MAKRKRNQPTKAQANAAPNVVSTDTGFAVMRWDQKIVWICLHLLLFLVPVAMGNLTFLGIGGGMPISFDQFDIVKLTIMRATTIIAVAAWGAGMLLQGGKLRRTRIDWFIVAFLAWVLVSTVFSIHVPTAVFGKYRRFEGLLSFINYASVFFLIVQVADRGSRIRSLARSLVVSSIFVTLYGLIQYAGKDFVRWGNLPFENTRSFSTYGNPDLLGGFLVIALPIAAALALSESSRLWRVTYWIATLFLSAVMITAFTRGAWIGGFVAVAVLVWAAWRGQVKIRPLDWGFAAAAVLAVAAIIIRSFNSPNAVLNFGARLVSIFQFGEGSAQSRFQIWQAAIDAVKARPIVGFGADTFRLVFPMYKTEAYVQQVGYLSVADNVHNYPLQLMAGIGIPGFLLMYMMLAFALYRGAPVAFGRGNGTTRLLQAGVWAAVLGYLVHLLFGLSVTGVTVLMWAMMALALAPTARAVEVSRMQPNMTAIRSVGVALLVIGAMLLSINNIRYIVADRYYLMARVIPYDIATRVAYINKALELSPYNDMYRAELGLQYQSQFSQLAVQAQQQAAQGTDASAVRNEAFRYFELAERAMIDTIDYIPPEYDNYVFLSNSYNMAAEYFDSAYSQKAVEVAQRGVAVERYGPAVRFQLAQAQAALGRREEAIETLKLAVQYDPAYVEAKSMLAALLIDVGRADEARKLLEEILLAKPSDPFALSEIQRIGGTSTAGASETTAP